MATSRLWWVLLESRRRCGTLGGVPERWGGWLASLLSDTARLIDRRAIHVVFHSLVHLVDGEVVGFEALARGPDGSDIEHPVALLAAAEQLGRLDELDWLCAATAARLVRQAHLHPSMTIFLNVKASTLLQPPPDDLAGDLTWAKGQLRVVAEIDELELCERPGVVLSAAARVRDDGWGVAVDNVGTTPASLALLPVLHPDVVKLDCRALTSQDAQHSAEIETAVRAYSEMSGAVILAQRIETDDDLLTARSFGASYAQGWRYGRPGPIPTLHTPPKAPFPLLEDHGSEQRTPFELVSGHRTPIPTEKRHLIRISQALEQRAATNNSATVLLACFQTRRSLTADLAQRYVELARTMSYTALFAATGHPLSLPGVHFHQTDPFGPLRDEWDVIVISPNYTGALVAHDAGETGDEGYRRYHHILTHDPDLVIAAARALLAWINTDT